MVEDDEEHGEGTKEDGQTVEVVVGYHCWRLGDRSGKGDRADRVRTERRLVDGFLDRQWRGRVVWENLYPIDLYARTMEERRVEMKAIRKVALSD